MPSMSLTCAICNLPMQRSRTSAPQGMATHNACRGGDEREKKAAYMKMWHAEYRAKHGKSQATDGKRRARGVDPDHSVPCFSCGGMLAYVRTEPVRYPLHKECRATAPNWMRRGEDRPTPKRDAFQRKIDKAAVGTSGKRVFICGGCRWCGTSVVGVGFYCSDSCRKSAAFKRRSSGASFKISPRAREKIYERDSWTCQLCWHPVDSGLHYRDNWAASLDHIIPQSQQLIPDHSPSNLRLAHRMCNSMRGDGSNMTEREINSRIEDRFGESKIAA